MNYNILICLETCNVKCKRAYSSNSKFFCNYWVLLIYIPGHPRLPHFIQCTKTFILLAFHHVQNVGNDTLHTPPLSVNCEIYFIFHTTALQMLCCMLYCMFHTANDHSIVVQMLLILVKLVIPLGHLNYSQFQEGGVAPVQFLSFIGKMKLMQ